DRHAVVRAGPVGPATDALARPRADQDGVRRQAARDRPPQLLLRRTDRRGARVRGADRPSHGPPGGHLSARPVHGSLAQSVPEQAPDPGPMLGSAVALDEFADAVSG